MTLIATKNLGSPGVPSEGFNNWHLSFQASPVGNGCNDYLEIRSGGREKPLLFSGCRGETIVTISKSRWLWVHFFSDNNGIMSTGFQAAWSIVDAKSM